MVSLLASFFILSVSDRVCLENIQSLPLPNRMTMIVSNHIPSDIQITAAYVIAVTADGKFVFAKHRTRGWDILGGHSEPGESPEATARREAYEEGKVSFKELTLLGYKEIELLGEKPANYQYPFPKSYQVFFIARVDQIEDFQVEEDMIERDFFDLIRAKRDINWMKNYFSLFEQMILKFSTK